MLRPLLIALVVAVFIPTIMTVDAVNIGNSITSSPRIRTSIDDPSAKTSTKLFSPNTIHTYSSITSMMDEFKKKHPYEPTFIQAVEEMTLSLSSLFNHPTKGQFYQNAFRLMLEPDRIISFKVPWTDDNGTLRINTGYRVEFSSVLGPYKGGLRFHPTVSLDILKSLAFEQMFKNALTGLPLGGGKGGSDFDPKNKSQGEVLRFCVSFMTELHRYLGENVDVPAGDIGVGGRELGYMYGQYKRLTNEHGVGVLTGKPASIGGSFYRPEATGYGLVYIAKLAIEDKLKINLKNKKCAISGSGNVAQYAADKLLKLGAKVLTLSDSDGVLVFPDGMTEDDWETIIQAKQFDRLRLSQIEQKVSGYYVPDASPWSLPPSNRLCYDFAFPCATQNEIDKDAASILVEKRKVLGIFEGANIPLTLQAQSYLRDHQNPVIYIPGKAANAGGVGVSGFEMSQNVQKLIWDSNTVDEKLQSLMKHIYKQLVDVADADDTLEIGANKAGFIKLVQAMDDLGWLGEKSGLC